MISKAIAFSGYSGAGKTTLICLLIEHFRSRGLDVGAIKHTHHPLEEFSGGDTGRFLDAGARAAILAGENEAIEFRSEPTRASPRRFSWSVPSDLVQTLGTELAMIEGFKHVGIWPKVLVAAPGTAAPPVDPTVIARVGGSSVSNELQHFTRDDWKGLAGFLDRILGI